MTMCTVCIVIVIVFHLFSDCSIMSDYQDLVPFINSPSLVQHSQQSHGINDYGVDDPPERSQSDLSMENDRVKNDLHNSRHGGVPKPPLSQADTSRTGKEDQEEQRFQHPKTLGGSCLNEV